MTLWTVALTHYDINTTTETTITDNFISIPKATDTGTLEVNSATLVLSSTNGKFITSTPVIDEFDRIRIEIIDDDSSPNTYRKVFDVIKIIPSWTKREGVRVTLILQGMEHHLQKINHNKPFFYEGAQEVYTDIINSYNGSKGSTQPTVTQNTAELPTSNFSVNNYDFAVSQDSCFNRINEVVDKQGASVSDGGALDFYEIRFTNSVSDFTTLASNVFSGGSPTDGSEVTISETTSVNVGETESGIDSITGTVVHAWGAVDQGSVPVEFSKFNSGSRRFLLYPRWITGLTYKVNSIVQEGANKYICILEHVSLTTTRQPPNATYWTVRTANTDYGSIIYSPWTKGKAGEWADGGIDSGDIDSSGEIGPGFFDGNLIIEDTRADWFRTIVDVRVSASTPDPTDITSYSGGDTDQALYLYKQTDFYRGFRVLLQSNTNPTGKWAGIDAGGRAFKQGIIECVTAGDATTATWRVVYEALNTDKLVCSVRDEGITYIYDTGANTWTGQAMSTEGDHLHPYISLTNVSGIPNQGDGTFTNNTDSAIQARYEFNSLLNTGQGLHMVGAWLNFSFPFPNAKIQGSTDPGVLYGGSIDDRDAEAEPATLDVQNMHLTHDGFRGFNNGDSSEDFGQISSIDFWMNFNYQTQNPLVPGYTTAFEGNFKMTCLLVDSEDNVLSQEFTIPFNNQWMEYKIPISGFKIYRAREPLNTIITTIVPPKHLEVSNIFRWRNVKKIIWQTQESYDAEGRYRSDFLSNRYLEIAKTVLGAPIAIARADRRLDLAIDALHFTKPLLVNTGQDTTKCIENDFLEKPEIMDYYQLKNEANAEKEKRKFRHVEFDITTTGKVDINCFDYFLYENTKLIPTEFKESGTNKIKLMAKHIEYSITKPVKGKGGFLRRILGVRRFQ